MRSYLSSELELNVVDRIKEEAEEDTIRRLLIHKQNLLAQIITKYLSIPLKGN